MELLSLSNNEVKDFSKFNFTDDLYDILDIDELGIEQYNNFKEALKIVENTINNKFFDQEIDIIYLFVEDLPFKYKKYFLKKMVNSGLLFAFEFSQIFNIDTSFLTLNDFMKGFELANDDIFYKEGFDDFISLYKGKENIYLKIAELGYINFYGDLLEKDIPFEKFSDKKMDDLFVKFKNILDIRKDLTSKMNYTTNSYLFDIVEIISQNPTKYIEKLKQIIKISDLEKQELDKIKKEKLEEFYNTLKDSIKVSLSSYELVVEVDILNKNNLDFLLNSIKTRIGMSNDIYDWSFVFLTIKGETRIISFSNSVNKKFLSGEEFYDNKEIFFNRVDKIIDIYKFFVEENNLDCSFFVFKTPSFKEDFDNDLENKKAA